MTWKERRTATVLASILAILFAVVLIILGIRYRQNRPTAPQGDTAGTFVSSDGTEIPATYTALSYSNGTATLSFTLGEDGKWVWADGPDFPLDSLTIQAVAEELSNLKFQQTLPATEEMESYGLSNPAATLSATDGQGVTRTLAFGKTTTDGNSYYIQMNGDESTVYIIADTLYNYIQTPIYDMCLLPELPDLSEKNLVALTIQGPIPASESGGDGEGEEEASEPEPPITLLVARKSGEDGAVLWFHENDNVSGSEQVSDIVKDLGSLTISKCMDYYPSDEAASICGFTSPAAVLTAAYGAVGTEQSLILTVGSQSADGTGRYVRLNEEAPIYLLSSEYLDALVSVASDGLKNS